MPASSTSPTPDQDRCATAGDPARPDPPAYRADLAAIRSGALAELTKVPNRWVCWRYEWRGSDWTKPPYRPNGARADVSKPVSWFDFERCAAALDGDLGFAGVGFVLDGSDDLVGIDFDDCIGPGIVMDPALKDFIARLDSYTEGSPSGAGLRSFLRGQLGRDSVTFQVGGVTGVAFRARRYLTVTGDWWFANPDSIEHRQGVLDWIIEQQGRHGSSSHSAAGARTAGVRHDHRGSGAVHWFDRLPEERRGVEVERMLACLTDPIFGTNYELWLKTSFAVHHATDGQGYAIWDAWCQQLPGYDSDENAYKWTESFETDRPDPATVGSLIPMARAHGYQPPRTVNGADAAPLSTEQLDEINARLRAYREQQAAPEPEPTSGYPLEYPPGLLGALVDHGAARCPIASRRPALVGSLVGLATASANRYAVRVGHANPMSINQFVGLVAETGDGKETAIDWSQKIAAAAGVPPCSFASDIGIHQALAKERRTDVDPKVLLVPVDEWGHMLQQIKGERAGPLKAMMTMLMKLRGMAIDGALPARKYAKSKDDLPEVSSPFVNALFATTPRTIHDALTSAEVVDGSLNKIPILYVEPGAALRPLAEIVRGPLPANLDSLIKRRLRLHLMDRETMLLAQHLQDEHADGFRRIEIEPDALALLDAFRERAHKLKAGDLGALWARAFENAVRLAGVCALGEAIGTIPDAEMGELVIRPATAAWAIALVEHSIGNLSGDLAEHLSDHEADRIQKLILRHAVKMREEAAKDTSPVAEHTAPMDKQQEMRDLKKAGWFLRRRLVRKVSGQGRSYRDVKTEIDALIEGGALASHVVEWGRAKTWPHAPDQVRVFITRVPEE